MLPDLSGLGCGSDSTFAPLLLAAIHHAIRLTLKVQTCLVKGCGMPSREYPLMVMQR